jgi:serine-type D-Ala-D-Ala carboxypeptidase/endopeptidase
VGGKASVRRKNLALSVPILEGGAGLRSSANDMAKFISANLGFTSPNGVALHEARKLTWNKGAIAGGKLVHDKTNLLYHGGSTGGYISFIVIDTARKQGVFVVSNSQDSVEDIGLHIVDNTFPLRPIPAPKKEIALSEEILERYVGQYQLPDFNLTFNITREGSRLFLQQNEEARVRLFPEKETEFFLKVIEAAITFTKDENGRVNGLILHQKGDHIGKRVK